MQYTIRNIPKQLDQALRSAAKLYNRSLNQLAIEAMAHGLRVMGHPVKKNDFSRFLGTWVEDPAFDEAMKDFERIDLEEWNLPDAANRTRHKRVPRSQSRQSKHRKSA